MRTLLGSAGDAGWFLLGLATWVLSLGSATVEVGNDLTGHGFRFPGWLG